MNNHYTTKIATIILIYTICCIAIEHSSDSLTKGKRFFTGGMAVTGGYFRVVNSAGTYYGTGAGLGGRILFFPDNNIRIGAGGAAVSATYPGGTSIESSFDFGYGGLIAEFGVRFKKSFLALGTLLGGGTVTNSHILTEHTPQTAEILYKKATTVLLVPHILLEQRISQSIAAMLAFDLSIGVNHSPVNILGTPRVHLGILFSR